MVNINYTDFEKKVVMVALRDMIDRGVDGIGSKYSSDTIKTAYALLDTMRRS